MASETLTIFERFPRLPVELRLKIWKDTLPRPLIIEVDYLRFYIAKESYGKVGDDDNNSTTATNLKLGFRTTTPEISILKACHESRDVALVGLPILLPSSLDKIEIRLAVDDALQINGIGDLIRDMRTQSYAIPHSLKKICTVAHISNDGIIGTKELNYVRDLIRIFMGSLAGDEPYLFPGLEHILLLCVGDQILSGDCISDFRTGPADISKLPREQFESKNQAERAKDKLETYLTMVRQIFAEELKQAILPHITIVTRGCSLAVT